MAFHMGSVSRSFSFPYLSPLEGLVVDFMFVLLSWVTAVEKKYRRKNTNDNFDRLFLCFRPSVFKPGRELCWPLSEGWE